MKNTTTNTTTNETNTNINMEDIMNTTTIHTLDNMTLTEARTWGWGPAQPHEVIAWDPIDYKDIDIWASWEDALKDMTEVVYAFCDYIISWERLEAIAVAVTAQACAEVRGGEDEAAWVQLRPEFAGDDDALDRLIEAAITAGEEE